jgi:hypothetical protein
MRRAAQLVFALGATDITPVWRLAPFVKLLSVLPGPSSPGFVPSRCLLVALLGEGRPAFSCTRRTRLPSSFCGPSGSHCGPGQPICIPVGHSCRGLTVMRRYLRFPFNSNVQRIIPGRKGEKQNCEESKSTRSTSTSTQWRYLQCMAHIRDAHARFRRTSAKSCQVNVLERTSDPNRRSLPSPPR